MLLRTLSIGQDLEHFEQLDSTNAEMLRRLKYEELPNGKLIMAEQQIEGKGQRGAGWESESGKDLTFSILLRPRSLSPDEQFDLSRAVTLGIAEAVRYLHPPSDQQLHIKWPNDLLLEGRKLAGVLIENSVQAGRISNAVVGIGFDLRRTEREERIGHTSLERETGLVVKPEEMLECLCKSLERRYFQLEEGDLKGIRENFNERCYLLGYRAQFSDDEGDFIARIREVDPGGRLVLEHANGEEQRYSVKELRFRGPAL